MQREQRQGRVRSWEGSGLVTEGGVVDSADKTEGHFWKRETHIHFSEPGHLAFCPLRPALKTTMSSPALMQVASFLICKTRITTGDPDDRENIIDIGHTVVDAMSLPFLLNSKVFLSPIFLLHLCNRHCSCGKFSSSSMTRKPTLCWVPTSNLRVTHASLSCLRCKYVHKYPLSALSSSLSLNLF